MTGILFLLRMYLIHGGASQYIRGSNGIRNRILRTSSERVKGQMLVLYVPEGHILFFEI